MAQLRGLPELHPDAIGATVAGIYYTREEYEALRAEALRPPCARCDRPKAEHWTVALEQDVLRRTVHLCPRSVYAVDGD